MAETGGGFKPPLVAVVGRWRAGPGADIYRLVQTWQTVGKKSWEAPRTGHSGRKVRAGESRILVSAGSQKSQKRQLNGIYV